MAGGNNRGGERGEPCPELTFADRTVSEAGLNQRLKPQQGGTVRVNPLDHRHASLCGQQRLCDAGVTGATALLTIEFATRAHPFQACPGEFWVSRSSTDPPMPCRPSAAQISAVSRVPGHPDPPTAGATRGPMKALVAVEHTILNAA
jgi:hypothetical protein